MGAYKNLDNHPLHRFVLLTKKPVASRNYPSTSCRLAILISCYLIREEPEIADPDLRNQNPMAEQRAIQIGYKLSSEEFPASDLVRFAQAAEHHGFSFALISDHYHPWTDREGQSPFVWSVIGAISQATDKLIIGTGVTCPALRIHP